MWHPDTPVEYRNQIVTGDAKELAKRIPDNSVDLIFTDPVYDRIEDYAWLAETAARVLKADGHLLAWQQVGLLPATYAAMSEYMVYRWTLVMTRSNIPGYVRTDFFTHWTPCIWHTKTSGVRVVKRFRDAIDDPYIANQNGLHKWLKPSKPMRQWLPSFVRVGGIAFDPFTGSGTVPAECKRMGVNYIAFEIDPATAERARVRVAQTQAMHPVLLGVQEPLALEEVV